jgi:integrase
VARLIDSARNLYHRTLLMTLYSTAMRRAELCRLKVRDIDGQRMMIRIDQGKGSRDRDVPLSPTLLETLRVYWRWMKPTTYLFPGTVRGVRADVPITTQCGLVSLSASRSSRQHPQTRFSALSPPQLCFSPSRGRRRPAHHSGLTRTLQAGAHPRLPASLIQASAGDHQSARYPASIEPRQCPTFAET